jgi:hypothetical protein
VVGDRSISVDIKSDYISIDTERKGKFLGGGGLLGGSGEGLGSGMSGWPGA